MKKKPNPVERRGRPRNPRMLRRPMRYNPQELAAWKLSAARAGVTVDEWIAAVLNAEAAKAIHVPRLA